MTAPHSIKAAEPASALEYCRACDEFYTGSHCSICFDDADFDDHSELRSAEDYSRTMRFWGRDPLKPETWL